jgi:hypothetical protein
MGRSFAARVSFCVIFLSALLCAQTSKTKCTSKIYVGILDDAREEMVNWKPGVAHERLIRPAFEKSCSGWHEITSESVPPDTTWTVAFDGREIGTVRGQAETTGSEPTERNSGYLTLVQKIPAAAGAIPSVGVPSEVYAPMAIGPTKGRRPLVVVSAQNFSDPDGWKRVPRSPAAIAKLVRLAFRRDFPQVVRCEGEEIVEKSWKFPDTSLSLPVAYASNKNSFLVETRLDSGDCGYVDDPNDPLSDPWFFVSADGNVRRIGSFMTLLDAGDYDNDGRSELVFMVNQPEDTDGFVLFDADLRKQGSLLWSYH